MTQNAFEMSWSVEQLWDADIPVNYIQIRALIMMLIHPAYSWAGFRTAQLISAFYSFLIS